ncbi:MAG: hypothetical protein IJQ81_18100 [Oscillibacter sp.]|nr:hypothetical protein [Oscillibacter sp.]
MTKLEHAVILKIEFFGFYVSLSSLEAAFKGGRVNFSVKKAQMLDYSVKAFNKTAMRILQRPYLSLFHRPRENASPLSMS